jgi:hypothetical protein
MTKVSVPLALYRHQCNAVKLLRQVIRDRNWPTEAEMRWWNRDEKYRAPRTKVYGWLQQPKKKARK